MVTHSIIHAIDGATATTSSTWIPVTHANKVSFIFKRSNHSSGNTAFSVSVSADAVDANAITYAKLIDNLTNTNGQNLTRISSKTLAANGLALVSMSPEDIVGYIKVTATETTDGTHDAWVIIQYY